MYSRRVPFHAVKYITNKFAFMTWQGDRSSRVHYQELCAPGTVSQKFCQWILRPKAQELSMDPQTQGRRSVHDRTNYFDKAFPIKPRLYLLLSMRNHGCNMLWTVKKKYDDNMLMINA
jgi:hypothetical protein